MSEPPTTRARLLKAQEHVSKAFEILDQVAPQLEEPERSAILGLMGLRSELTAVIRALGNIALSVGAADK